MLKRDSFYESNEEEDSVCEPTMLVDLTGPSNSTDDNDKKSAAIQSTNRLPLSTSNNNPSSEKMPAAASAAAMPVNDPEASDRMIKIAAASSKGSIVIGPSANRNSIDALDMKIKTRSQQRIPTSTAAASANPSSMLSSMDQDIAAKAHAREEQRNGTSMTPGVTSSSITAASLAPAAENSTAPLVTPTSVIVSQISDLSLGSVVSANVVRAVNTNDRNQNAPVVAVVEEEDQQPLIETEWLPGDDYLPGDEFPEDTVNNINIHFDNNPDGTTNNEGTNNNEDMMDQALLAVTVDPVLEADVIDEDDPKAERRKVIRNACICLVCFIIISISIAVPITIKFYTRVTEMPTSMPSFMPSSTPSAAPSTEEFKLYMEALYPISGDIDIFYNRSSPQYKALYWLYYDDIYTTLDSSNFTQRYILAVFYYSTNGDTWFHCHRNDKVCKDKRRHYLDHSSSECDWYGNFCKDDGWRVTSLQFATSEGMNFSGTIANEITHLTALEGIFLVNNPLLTGTIPKQIGKLENLTRIYLYANHLESPLPKSLVKLKNTLVALSIWDNYFKESIPSELGQMNALEELGMSNNFFNGTIPKELGSLSNLESLILLQNELVGKIPEEIYDLQNLEYLNLSYNSLSGKISASIKKLLSPSSSLKTLKIANNSLTGTLPSEMFIDGGTSKLKEFDISKNKFSGNLPDGIENLVLINEIRLEENDLKGNISASICALKDKKLEVLTADCVKKIVCDCCTECF